MAGKKSDDDLEDALSAWRRLKRVGGLDLGDRDSDLEPALLALLPAEGDSLEDALRRSSTDDLVRALLRVSAPYAEMFKGILRFFQAAGAREGRQHWQVRIEEDHLDLRDFISFVETWTSVETQFELPLVDQGGLWKLTNFIGERLRAFERRDRLGGDAAPAVGPEVQEWLAAYHQGEYRPLPEHLRPGTMSPGLADAAALAWYINGMLVSIWGSRQTIRETFVAEPSVPAAPLTATAIARNENDHWLGQLVEQLDRTLRLAGLDRAALASGVEDELSPYPRRSFGAQMDVPSLEAILSLPVWQRRHELYAVWVATEMVEAFDGHEYELHHEDGRIVFAFRETVVATIASARPEKRLFAERKVPLANPVGKSRKANVQPDYGLWSDAAGAEVCDLIVEVKHYKRDSKKRFREVLIDYAAAHPEGTIVLVNHGPAADMLEGIAAKAASRCRVLGELKPGNTAQREVFRKIVRDHVGEPVVESGLGIAGPGTAILIDISISMGPLLRSEQFASSLAAMARSGAGTVALADTAIRSRCTAAEALAAARSHPGGGSTNLTGPINMLLREFPRVLVLTDNDGLSDIGPFTKDWRCEDGLVQAEILREGSADGGR